MRLATDHAHGVNWLFGLYALRLTESLNDTSGENRVVGRCICSPDVGTKKHGESSNDSGSFSEDQGQWNPDEVAQSESEDVVVGQKRDLIDGDLKEFRIWE